MQTDRHPADRSTIQPVLDLVPSSTFLLTSAVGEVRSGVIVRCVQQVATNPPMILVAMEKGQPLSPVIRDSRNFALCVLPRDERSLRRQFATAPDQGNDPFLTIPHITVPGGSPVPLRSVGYIACELIRHLDIEADYEVYIGMVHTAALVESPKARPPRATSSRTPRKPRGHAPKSTVNHGRDRTNGRRD